jgi:hypothetical protein
MVDENDLFADGSPMPQCQVTDCVHFAKKYFGNIAHEECSIRHYEKSRPCSRYKKQQPDNDRSHRGD